MRIIAGKYKSRKIHYGKASSGSKDKDNDVYRPTTDRAKESVFNTLNNIIDFDSTTCLDLFAGSGSLGFEALSRGASRCDFVEISFKQLRGLQRTAAELDVTDQVKIYQSDVLDFLYGNSINDYDCIFADPPYDYNKYDALFNTIFQSLQGIFVLEHSANMHLLYDTNRFSVKSKKIGISKFEIFMLK